MLALAPGVSTREQLARLAVAVDDAGRRIDGIVVADPDPSDRTTGRRTLDERSRQAPLPLRVTGISSSPVAAQRTGDESMTSTDDGGRPTGWRSVFDRPASRPPAPKPWDQPSAWNIPDVAPEEPDDPVAPVRGAGEHSLPAQRHPPPVAAVRAARGAGTAARRGLPGGEPGPAHGVHHADAHARPERRPEQRDRDRHQPAHHAHRRRADDRRPRAVDDAPTAARHRDPCLHRLRRGPPAHHDRARYDAEAVRAPGRLQHGLPAVPGTAARRSGGHPHRRLRAAHQRSGHQGQGPPPRRSSSSPPKGRARPTRSATP